MCYNIGMIKVYTTKTCVYCHALMDWLEQQGIEYQEIDATTMPGITAVPVTEINGERIIGFDRPAIKRALAEAQNASSKEPAEQAEDHPKAA